MLKWIALILMLVDHFAYTLGEFMTEDIYFMMRSVGRISFPVFVYYVMLGLGRTSNLSRYMSRLLIFAVFAEVVKRAFPFFVDPYLNVIFSLLLYGVFYLLLEDRLGKFKLDISTRVLLIIMLTFILPYVEYGYGGFLVFLSLYYINKYVSNKRKFIYSAILITLAFVPDVFLLNMPNYQLFAGVSGLLMFNKTLDKRVLPPKVEKWTFYWVYPLQWIFFGLLLIYMWN